MWVLLVLGPHLVAGASARQNAEPDLGVRELYAYAAFLDAHSNVASAVDATPSLVPGEGTLQQFPELSTFIEQHPDLKNSITTNPGMFQSLEQRYLALVPSRLPIHRTVIIWFDRLLSSNPQLRSELQAAPNTIDAPDTLSRNLPLKNFLQTNPYFPQLFKGSPIVFLGTAPAAGN